jgi:hypothetical protein
MRKYPVGIQSFEKLRTEGYLYVDKTPLVYKMITEGKPYFLNRPRRFGKSLLISTLAAVFEGRLELFEAFTTKQGIEQPQLFIARSDWEWEKYPVIRFDFSAGDLVTIEQLETLIDETLKGYERQYGIVAEVKDANIRMVNLMRTLHKQTGKRVVVLVDEYDNFILHALGNAEKVTQARQRFQNVFGPLKAEDDHLQFAFITGISKFSQMGVFSKLNNLNNISMQPAYETICGISEEELTTQLRPDIELMAQRNDTDYDGMFARLKKHYDGYHFSTSMVDMYNPFSLVNVFSSGVLDDYWFDRGTSSALIKLLAQMPPVDITEVEGIRLPSTAFDLPLETYDDPLPILYQSGYLTIKDSKNYDFDIIYTLGFPNAEVRRGFADCLFKHVAGKQVNSRQSSALQLAYYDFRANDDLPTFIEAIKTFFAGVPFQWEKDNKNEHYYHALLYTLLVAFGADVRAEEPSAKGCSDITLKMPKGIYVMELKYDDTADAALEQINRKGYADKYALEGQVGDSTSGTGRPVTKVGIAFSSKERNITEWKVEKG